MQLILTEKPSVARDIATGLTSNFTQKDGFIEADNGETIITHAFGHLYHIDQSIMPREKELPFFPAHFRYETTSSGGKQARIIKNLLQKAEKVIIATDAGREGELIARLILNQSGWTSYQNTYRFWTSQALSPQVVKANFQSLKPATIFDNYYFSSLSRQHSDFILGLNLSRIASIKGGGIWSVGRVQTPVLRMICDRFQERKNFNPQEYFVIDATFQKGDQSFDGILFFEENDQLSKDISNQIFQELKPYISTENAVVSHILKEEKTEKPPVLHSLTSLQQEANKVYGYTAAETLKIAQSLYETHKALSYPRTDSNFMSNDDQQMVKKILLILDHEDLEKNINGNKIFNSSKLTDHHALVPLQNFQGDGKEQNIFDLVKRRFLAVFSDSFKYEVQKVFIKIESHPYTFISTGKKIIESGWSIFYDQKEKFIPVLAEGEKLNIENIQESQKWTKPPSEFNDSSILKKMENLNLGTPATRSGILEKLVKVGYVERQKKSLVATEKGLELITKINSSQVTSPELTQEWEIKLEKVKDKNDYLHFLDAIKQFTTQEVHRISKLDIKRSASSKQINFAKSLAKQKGISLPENIEDFDICKGFIEKAMEMNSKPLLNCQMCSEQGNVIDFGKGFKCESCGRIVWKKVASKTLTETQVKNLFEGQKIQVKGLKSKTGNTFDAELMFKDKEVKIVNYLK